MNETPNVLRGILHPDGTLELAERPTLPAGDVEVTIRPVPIEPPTETLWQFMERTRAELEASGHGFRTKEEIDADLENDRDWGEERLEAPRRPTEGYGPYLARIRARREADGYPFRTKEEIDAEIEGDRDSGEARLDEIRGPIGTERPTLPTDPVEVTIPPVVAEKEGENWFECLQRIRAEREASGDRFLTEEEVDAYMEDVRDWGEARLDEIRGRLGTGRPGDKSK